MSRNSNMKFFYVGIAIALLLSVLAPFLASPDPDGLESRFRRDRGFQVIRA